MLSLRGNGQGLFLPDSPPCPMLRPSCPQVPQILKAASFSYQSPTCHCEKKFPSRRDVLSFADHETVRREQLQQAGVILMPQRTRAAPIPLSPRPAVLVRHLGRLVPKGGPFSLRTWAGQRQPCASSSIESGGPRSPKSAHSPLKIPQKLKRVTKRSRI
jgi:hypothetical protein